MSASVYKVNGTGAAAIATSLTVPAGQTYRLVSVTCKFNVAPVTSDGPAFDTTIMYVSDPPGV